MGGRITRRSAAVAALAAVCGGAAIAAPSAAVPTVKASPNAALGATIVVTSKGLTLYHYLPDTKRTVKCTGPCAVLFPPLVVPAGTKPVAGPGLAAAKLGTVKRPDGKLQVTYNGLTLYRDYYDKSAGEVNGQGQQRVWYVVTAAGTVTKARAVTAPPPVESSTSQPTPSAPSDFPQAAGPPPDCVDSDC